MLLGNIIITKDPAETLNKEYPNSSVGDYALIKIEEDSFAGPVVLISQNPNIWVRQKLGTHHSEYGSLPENEKNIFSYDVENKKMILKADKKGIVI